ncbi:MAG TPA: GGDEF domain-containing protein [Rugosimonospora sp.]|nr:GGDEF domain-containing protein [Rugosimonospora sp.]
MISRILTLFRPAAALVGRLRYAQKFLVAGLALAIPLGVLASAYVDGQRGQVAFSARERQGVAYLAPLDALTGAVVAARHLAVTQPTAAPLDLTPHLARVDAVDARYGAALDAQADWQDARQLILAAQQFGGTAGDSFRMYNSATAALLAMTVHIGDESNLTLDPELDSYYLMDTLQFRLPVLLDTAGRAVDRAALARLAQDPVGDPAAGASAELGLDNGVLSSTRAVLAHAATTVVANTQDLLVRTRARADFLRLDAAVRALCDVLGAAGPGGSAAVPPDAADRTRAAAGAFATDAAAGLDSLLRARIDRLSARALRVEAVAAFGAALALYVFAGFYLSVVPPIRRLVATLHAVAAGDLRRRVEVGTRDELSFVARTLNDTVAQTGLARDRLAAQATRDTLTGLPNRAMALDQLHTALARRERDGGVMAVLFIDLDRFKIINDSLGHEAGDEVLRTIAARLTQGARATDTVARLSGDEFVMISEGLTRPADAVRLGERIVTELSRPVRVLRGREVGVGASVGIAYTHRGTTTTAEQLLRDADLAMYRAKQRGRGLVEIFDDRLRVAAEHRVEVEDELRHGLDAGQLRVHYQPIVAAADGTVTGFEALARWQHPEHGLLGPDRFIEVAEESGLIVPLGAAVLEEACRQVAYWRAHRPGGHRLSMSVNVSARQFSLPSFVPTVAQVLADTGLEPDALWLEITETSLMADEAVARTTLAAVRALGVHLAIDDFGTGYSPLTYLRRFPVEALKIDRSFVSGIGRDREDEAIVTMVLALARSLDLRTVAEGVETAGQREWLCRLGCTALQGYHLGRPVPAERAFASRALHHAA